MKLLKNDKDNQVINSLKNGEYSLLDSLLVNLELKSSEGKLNVSVVFELKKRKGQTINITFENVVEFGFYYSEEYVFYNVDSFKLLSGDEFVYLSLDPDMTNSEAVDTDQDFIKSESMSVYIEDEEIKRT